MVVATLENLENHEMYGFSKQLNTEICSRVLELSISISSQTF